MADKLVSKTQLKYFKQKLDGTLGNKIEVVKVNGQPLNIEQKAVNVTVPTKVSQITNDSGFQTSQQVQSSINSAIGKITQFDFQVVESLPGSGKKGIIYLVSNHGSGNNIYDEFIWVDSKFEKIGTTAVDLSGYYDMASYPLCTNSDIDEMFA